MLKQLSFGIAAYMLLNSQNTKRLIDPDPVIFGSVITGVDPVDSKCVFQSTLLSGVELDADLKNFILSEQGIYNLELNTIITNLVGASSVEISLSQGGINKFTRIVGNVVAEHHVVVDTFVKLSVLEPVHVTVTGLGASSIMNFNLSTLNLSRVSAS